MRGEKLQERVEGARRSLDEMQGIRLKILSETPDFLFGIFERLAEEHYLAIDATLHGQLVEAGIEATKSNDIEQLRFVIGKMFGNRVSTGADTGDIVELAHLLGS